MIKLEFVLEGRSITLAALGVIQSLHRHRLTENAVMSIQNSLMLFIIHGVLEKAGELWFVGNAFFIVSRLENTVNDLLYVNTYAFRKPARIIYPLHF